MAYVDQTARRPSLRIGLAVGLLHVGVGAALLTTFAGGAIRAVIHDTLQANDWTYVPPPPPKTPDRKPPPPTTGQVTPAQTPADPRTPANPLPQTGPLILPQGDTGPIGVPTPGPIVMPSPEPLPTPTVTPQRAVPRGDPGGWVTRDDYPTQAVRENWTGVTRFRLTIGRDGRVLDCAITGSSGHDLLDATACNRITSRARFRVATDETGAATTGIYLGSIRWELSE
ncbi:MULTISPECIES: energy transducer TonB [unclassified Sphingomonas]|uniref:energy transducer TonB n=1 Tax=Novosphingobium rhizosphaerae TaxID=1551649 RepID=UPI0015C95751